MSSSIRNATRTGQCPYGNRNGMETKDGEEKDSGEDSSAVDGGNVEEQYSHLRHPIPERKREGSIREPNLLHVHPVFLQNSLCEEALCSGPSFLQISTHSLHFAALRRSQCPLGSSGTTENSIRKGVGGGNPEITVSPFPSVPRRECSGLLASSCGNSSARVGRTEEEGAQGWIRSSAPLRLRSK